MSIKNLTVFQLSGHRFLGVNEQGDKVMIDGDSPSTGMRPMELLLAALAGCTGYDIVDIMAKKRQPMSSYRIEARGERPDEGALKPYTRIVLTHIGSGPEVTEQALQRAAELSHEKYCSVSATLNCPVEIEVQIEPFVSV